MRIPVVPRRLWFFPDYSADPLWAYAGRLMISFEYVPVSAELIAVIRAWSAEWEAAAYRFMDSEDEGEGEGDPALQERLDAIAEAGRPLCERLRAELGEEWKLGFVDFDETAGGQRTGGVGLAHRDHRFGNPRRNGVKAAWPTDPSQAAQALVGHVSADQPL